MLEHIGSSFLDLHRDLKEGNNSSWQQYALAGGYPDPSRATYYQVDQSDIQSPLVYSAPDTKFFRQYFRFIRAAAVRIEAQTTDNTFDPVAFINADSNPIMPGKWVVVVNASRGGEFNIAGLPEGVYGRKYTTAAEYDIDLPDQTIASGEIVSGSIPAMGVFTVYAK